MHHISKTAAYFALGFRFLVLLVNSIEASLAPSALTLDLNSHIKEQLITRFAPKLRIYKGLWT